MGSREKGCNGFIEEIGSLEIVESIVKNKDKIVSSKFMKKQLEFLMIFVLIM